MKEIKVNDPIFGLHLQIIFDEEEFEALTDVDVSLHKGTHVMINNNGRHANLIFLRNSKDVGCLCHELLHFVVKNLEVKGINIDSDHDETAAYLYEYFFNEIAKEMGIKTTKS